MSVFTTGLGADVNPTGSSLDERAAAALGFTTSKMYMQTPLIVQPTDNTMLYIGLAGLVLAALTYFGRR